MTWLLKRAITVLWAVTAVAVTARSAAADQIQLTAGTLQMAGSFAGSVSLEGERGFTLNAGVAAFDSAFAPWNQCLPCAPGTNVSLNGTFVGSSLHGAVVTLDGVTFTNVGGITSPHSAALVFTGGPVVPPLADQELVTLVAPFLFTGLFSGALLATSDPLDRVTVDLVGQGAAAVTLQRFLPSPEGLPLWRFSSAVYSFDDAAPIPEPATMLLTGAGLALLARRRWSRARKAEPSL